MLSFLLLGLAAGGADSGWSFSAVPSACVAFRPSLPGHGWLLGDAESYGGNWKALRADPEVARQWDSLPALATLSLGASVDSFRLRVVLPVRRDLEAWATDPSGSNIPAGAQELDINVPYEGWVRWSSPRLGSFQAGRFRMGFSESQHGVILGGGIVHDALWWRLPMGRWTFDWFASSLNPWLPGIASDGSVEAGSEAQRQRTATIANSRGRIYDDPWKTLFLHRLSVRLGDWDLAVVEQLMVGGKAPAIRDFLPLAVWHDNFGDGYSKISTALDVQWDPGAAGRWHLQGLLEDVRSPVGEVEGADPRAIFAVNAGWSGEWTLPIGRIGGALDATATSPTLNNHELPLLKGISRRLLRSNNQDQDSPGFSDTWIVDQPLAYHRGPDAADLWGSWGWTAPGGEWGGGLETDFLQQGDATLWESEDSLSDRTWPLSGIVEREARVVLSAWHRRWGWSFQCGGGGARIWNRNHVRGDRAWAASLFGQAGRSF